MEFLGLKVFVVLIFKLHAGKIVLYVNDYVVEKESGFVTKFLLHF